MFASSLRAEEAVLEEPVSVVLEEAALPPVTDPIASRDELMGIFPKEGYTINYNTLSIVEYIRFASKICNVNFIFDETELNFNVTVVSEGPITAKNVMATLVQLLRIHGLSLLEQDNNLVIHKNADVKQIAKLVTGKKGDDDAPIVTRIFRLKMMKPDALAGIIRPMLSKDAILDVSAETKQLILTDVTVNVDKVALLIENLDMPFADIETQTYETKHNSAEYLIGLATQILQPVVQGYPFIMVPQPLARTIYIVSTAELNQKAMAVLHRLDTPPKKGALAARAFKADNIYVYRVEKGVAETIMRGLHELAADLKHAGIVDYDLLEALQNAKLVRETHSIVFVASKETIEKLKEFLPALDVSAGAIHAPGGPQAVGEKQFLVYTPHYQIGEHLLSSLKEMEKDLQASQFADPTLLRSLESAKWISSSNLLLVTGDADSLKKVAELLAALDVSPVVSKRSGYYVYKLTNTTTAVLEDSMKALIHNLKHSAAADPKLIHMLESLRYLPGTNSVLITGSLDTLEEVKTLIASYDSTPQDAAAAGHFFLYKLLYATPQKAEQYLGQLAHNLAKDGSSLDLVKALNSRKWMEDSHSFLFSGPEIALAKIKEILTAYDLSAQAQAVPGYFLYSLQNTTGDLVEEDLERLAKNLKESGMIDTKLIQVLNSMRYVKETNSILLTGDAKAIEEAKELLAKYDYPRPNAAVPALNQFFLYKPQALDAMSLQKVLRDVAENLKKSQLADPSFLSTIESMKYVDSTNSIIFTGTQEALQKLQTLLKDVDVASQKSIQHLGKTSFLLYKLQYAPQEQMVGAITKIVTDLKKSGTSDKEFLEALASMRYISETNSLLFTGHEEALAKVQKLVEKFDTNGVCNAETQPGGQCCPGPSQFFLYAVQYLAGPDLIKMLQDFSEGVKSSGLCDPDLFHSIGSARWVEKTRSLVFTGTDKSLEQLKGLLKTFDIPSNLAKGDLPTGENPIEGIDDTSFLVYKLQFHKGDEIQNALRQIAKDLMASNVSINQNLLNAINSVQWIEVTNSLLCSGDQETLVRLRELIKTLDVPLKQVFIEMLVIQTSLSNSLTFGLEWGGKYKYRDKFSGTINNLIQSTASPPVLDTFGTALNNLTPPTAPTPIALQPNGFDLGIIGEVIRHNGNTYLTLGSLLNALQLDNETSIVMNPKIITQDSKTSNIFVGENIPFTGSFVSNQSNNTVSTTNIEYRDIGMSLTITPVLGNSDIVTLDVAFDQSVVTSGIQNQIAVTNGTTTTLEGVTTSKTSMQTTVHIPDNHFLILTGQVMSSQNKTNQGFPCLGGLPLIGAAFATENTTNTDTNVVIFIRPHILNSLEDMKKLSHTQEELFRDRAGTPFLEETFEEGMELIKTADDE